MKTKKLACQGCGADIDPIPGQKYIDCEYCGTTNVLESDTVHLPPGGVPQQPRRPGQVPPMQIRLPSGPSAKEMKKAGKIVALVVVSVVIAFLGVGAVIFIQVFRGVSTAQKQHRDAMKKANKTHTDVNRDVKKKMREAKRILNDRLGRLKHRAGRVAARVHRKKKRPFRIESDNPLTADANDDGIADALVRGSGGVVAAIDGTTAEVLWKSSHTPARRSRKLFVVGKLVLVSHGDHLTAFALGDGKQRWTTKLEDRVYQVALRKTGLAVETQDDELLTLDPATGKKKGGRTAGFKTLSAGDGRKWLSNLGRGHRLTGAAARKRRPGVYYCQSGFVLRGKTVRRRQGPFVTSTTTYGCKAKRALVYATDKRRRQAFLIGLGKGRGKIWETRLWGRAKRFGGNPAVAIREDLVAVAYKGRSTSGVVLLSMATGAKKWSHPLSSSTRIRGIALSPNRVFLRTGTWIELLDTKTGKSPVTSATSGAALPTPSGLPTP